MTQLAKYTSLYNAVAAAKLLELREQLRACMRE
jgi:hypothetical protein